MDRRDWQAYSPWGCKESGTTEQLSYICMYVRVCVCMYVCNRILTQPLKILKFCHLQQHGQTQGITVK